MTVFEPKKRKELDSNNQLNSLESDLRSVLLKWSNCCLKMARSNKVISNFGDDVSDSGILYDTYGAF